MARFPPAQVTEEEVIAALALYDGKISPASRKLNLSPSWLSKYLQRAGYVQRISWVKQAEDKHTA